MALDYLVEYEESLINAVIAEICNSVTVSLSPAKTGGTNWHKPEQILCHGTHFNVFSGGKLTCPLFLPAENNRREEGGETGSKAPLPPPKKKCFWFLPVERWVGFQQTILGGAGNLTF
jgi:hypothetical protein